MSIVTDPEALVREVLSGGHIRYSEAETFRGLTLIPLFLSRPPADRDYILFEEAVSAGTVVIDEVGGGIVSRLLVHNLGDRPVLLIDGE